MQYTEWTYRDFLRSEWWRRTSARLKRSRTTLVRIAANASQQMS